jgi:hypothetical protein
VDFTFACMPSDFSADMPDADGAYFTGMFVDGARWDYEAGELAVPLPKVSRARAGGASQLAELPRVPTSRAALVANEPACLRISAWLLSGSAVPRRCCARPRP